MNVFARFMSNRRGLCVGFKVPSIEQIFIYHLRVICRYTAAFVVRQLFLRVPSVNCFMFIFGVLFVIDSLLRRACKPLQIYSR